MSYFRRKADFNVCTVCGKYFDGAEGETVCPDCTANATKQNEIKDYIRDNKGVSAVDVMKKFGVSQKFLSSMTDITSGGSDSKSHGYPCQKCGKIITRGTYCNSCFVAMRQTMKRLSDHEAVIRSEVSRKDDDVRPESVILVIDPDERSLNIAKFILEKEFQGYGILTANSLLNSMNILRNHKVSLVILDDTVATAFDGLEILRRIRTDAEMKNTPVIIVSNKTVKENLATAFSLGISDYIIKPCEPMEMSSRVGKVLSIGILEKLESTTKTEKSEPEVQNSAPYNILLIDDNPTDLQDEENLLKEKFNCEIVTARGGIDGLYLLDGDVEFDLILVSMNMSFMDAFEFMTFIEKDSKLKFLPIVVMTESRSRATVMQLDNTIAKGFVVKPNFSDGGIDFLKEILAKKNMR